MQKISALHKNVRCVCAFVYNPHYRLPKSIKYYCFDHTLCKGWCNSQNDRFARLPNLYSDTTIAKKRKWMDIWTSDVMGQKKYICRVATLVWFWTAAKFTIILFVHQNYMYMYRVIWKRKNRPWTWSKTLMIKCINCICSILKNHLLTTKASTL